MARSKPNPMQLAQDPDVEVRRFQGARCLETIDLLVENYTELVQNLQKRKDLAGSIVRIRPGVDVSDGMIEEIRARVRDAIAVIVLPRPRAAVVPAQVAAATRSAMGAREAVLSLVQESNSRDRELLKAFCEKVMAEVGL